jgi:hypothetical protein
VRGKARAEAQRVTVQGARGQRWCGRSAGGPRQAARRWAEQACAGGRLRRGVVAQQRRAVGAEAGRAGSAGARTEWRQREAGVGPGGASTRGGARE